MLGLGAGDISNLAVGASEHLDRILGNIDRSHYLERGQVDHRELVRLGHRDQQKTAVGSGRRSVADGRQRYPGLDLVGCGVDDRQLRLGLIRGKDHLVVVGDSDALRL